MISFKLVKNHATPFVGGEGRVCSESTKAVGVAAELMLTGIDASLNASCIDGLMQQCSDT